MGSMKVRRGGRVLAGSLVTLLVVVAAVTITGCGGGGSSSGKPSEAGSESEGGSSKFPAATYPAKTYGNVSSPILWYDASGGALTAAKEGTIYKNFDELTGVEPKSEFDGEATKFFAAMENGQPPSWNVIEFATVGEYLHAEEEGYLEKIDPNVVPVKKLEPGTYDEYGFHTIRYGIVLAWNTKKYPMSGKHPESMTDLFNTKEFPGKRCMFKYPAYGATLEAPLLADGVEPEELYPLDLPKAYEKLDSIKSDILWYSSGDEVIRLLESGECDLGVAWSGRVFSAVEEDEAPLSMTWNDALYADAAFGIPKGAQNIPGAEAMLGFWLNDEQGQKELVEKVPYPTPYAKALTYPPSLEPWVPSGKNLEVAVAENEDYYAKHIEELSEEFNEWVGS
ncbi:MAG: extracellular solute-binding protein [Actinobacteria bacterium]|nr:extracellular solute-binding protein [Actinomycetota bacterium]